MNDLRLILQYGLGYGAVLSVLLSVLVMGSLYINPEMWLNDYPPEIKRIVGTMSERSKQQGRVVGLVFFALAIALPVFGLWQLNQRLGGTLTYLEALVCTYLMIEVFNLVDLLLLDFPLVALDPVFARIPGTENGPSYQTYGFHFRGFLVGLGIGLVASPIIAAVTFLW